ncbi:MAG: 4Fe-4S cluster-binding domain-containing protein [Defluviitaleaceae bacterium]|nr:4Fe-4S cluster-binding domain-containing protein [Defluviitaleaceae bacterium]
MLTVERLRHGGIMANYKCNAACRHCLYACSPGRSGGYITRETAEVICALLKEGGCRSVHIEGGEPFLDFAGLVRLVTTVLRSGIRVDYIETNGFWAADEDRAIFYLRTLEQEGADTLCISLDPFHAEYVPVAYPLRLAEICKRNRFKHFIWQERFLPALSRVEPGRAHSRKALEQQISPDYVFKAAQSYGLIMGGRALGIEQEYGKPQPLEEIMTGKQCGRLLSSDHFHVDLYGKFVPPGCTGIAIPMEEAVRGIPDYKYPAFEALAAGGVAQLLQYARDQGFTPAKEYTSCCALCFYIRQWLCTHLTCHELYAEHYEESIKYLC